VPVQISPVRSRRDLARFIDVPWKLFDRRRFPAWVPPLRLTVKDALDTKNNPFYQNADRELFLATRDGQLVGRIAAIENRAHNRFHEDKVGFFGFFECADDQEAADALFAAAEGWLKTRGLDTMRGPMNPSTNQECGLLIEGFDVHPVFMTNWNPAYFLPLLDRAGFVKAKDLYGYWYQASGPDKLTLPPRVAALARRAVTESGVTFRDIDIGRFDSEVDVLWDIYNSAWEKNWGFVPMTRAEFVHTARDLKPLVDPRLAFVAEVEGKPAGVMVNLLDYAHAQVEIGNGRLFPFGFLKLLAARRKLKSGRMMVLGIKAEHRTRSILPLFIHELVRRAEAMDAVGGEASWILEDNLQMVRTMELVGAPLYRKWRIYDRPIR
jgi:GNAT superfamily N-acetyltransferase